MQFNFKSLSLKKQILIILGISSVLIIPFVLLYVSETDEAFEQTNIAFAEEVATQFSDSIYNNYDHLINIVSYTANTDELQNFLLEEDVSIKYDLFQELHSQLTSLMSINMNISNFVVEDLSGSDFRVAGSNYELPELNLESSSIQLNTSFGDSQYGYFVLSTPIKSHHQNTSMHETIGFLHMFITLDAFSAGASKSFNEDPTEIFLYNSSGQCFWKNSERSSADLEALDPSQIITMDVEDLNFQIKAIYTEDTSLTSLYNIHLRFITILILLMLLIGFIWNIFISKVSNPLNKLTHFISNEENEPLEILSKQLHLEGYKEIEVIGVEFNQMLDQINTLTNQLVQTTTDLYETELAKEKAQYRYLRSQINPHFLYNTLESLKGLALESNDKKMVKFTKALSTIFKYSVKGKAEVALSEELNTIKSYIDIQLLRFENRFCVEYSIENDTLECHVPKMILQPLVENAIVHGIENADKCVKLTIRTLLVNSTLSIIIENDGIPISNERLLQIQSKLKVLAYSNDHTVDNVGIFNVNDRIKLMYGDAYGLLITSDTYSTISKLNLPIIDKRKDIQ